MIKVIYTLIYAVWFICVFYGIKMKKAAKEARKNNTITKEEAIKAYNKAFFLIVGSTGLISIGLILITRAFK